jgi:transposase
MSGGAALADASRGGSADGVGLRADHRESGSVSVWQADRELSGLVPLEKSSGNQRRLAHITKPGNSLLRFLLVEAAQATVRSLPERWSKYCHLTLRRGRKIAKVAMARKLAVHLYWMMRKEWDFEQLRKFGSYAGKPGHRDGVK